MAITKEQKDKIILFLYNNPEFTGDFDTFLKLLNKVLKSLDELGLTLEEFGQAIEEMANDQNPVIREANDLIKGIKHNG